MWLIFFFFLLSNMPTSTFVGVGAIKELKKHGVNDQINNMIRHDLLAPGIVLGGISGG